MSAVQELKLQILSDYRNLLSVAQLDLLRVQLGLLVDAAAQQVRAADVARRCPACNSLLEETSVYCDNCGTDTPRR